MIYDVNLPTIFTSNGHEWEDSVYTQHGKHVASQRLKASPPFLADLLFENSTYLSSSHSVQTGCSSTLDEASKFQLFFLSSPKQTAHLPANPPHSLCLHALFGLSLSHTQTHKLPPLASSLTPIHGLIPSQDSTVSGFTQLILENTSHGDESCCDV